MSKDDRTIAPPPLELRHRAARHVVQIAAPSMPYSRREPRCCY